jgi:hypothetical protein
MLNAERRDLGLDSFLEATSLLFLSDTYIVLIVDIVKAQFYCSSLANPAAPATGFPLRSNKLRGMRSLKHFHEISGLTVPWAATGLESIPEIKD